jgi:ABC-2 type transport system ATP-binding protein
LLDEPSSGLDPIVRRDILGAIVRTIAEEGRTVLFSSHLLDEVERISDRVAMLKEGRVLFTGELDDIKQTHRRLTFRFESERDTPPPLDGVLSWQGRGCHWTAITCGRLDDLILAASAHGAEIVEQKPLSLDEIFLAQVGRAPEAIEEV